MNSALKKFNAKVKQYRKKHPNVSFRSAQKKVKAMGSTATHKRKPVVKKKKISKARKVARPAARKRSSSSTVSSHIRLAKKGLEQKLGDLSVRQFKATTKPKKRKISKEIQKVKTRIRQLIK